MRLDAVEEIVQTEDIYNAIRMALRAINKVDLDKLITSVCSIAQGLAMKS
jgi:DNA mismatch repair protein MSH4